MANWRQFVTIRMTHSIAVVGLIIRRVVLMLMHNVQQAVAHVPLVFDVLVYWTNYAVVAIDRSPTEQSDRVSVQPHPLVNSCSGQHCLMKRLLNHRDVK